MVWGVLLTRGGVCADLKELVTYREVRRPLRPFRRPF
jgi:hypothetical protein